MYTLDLPILYSEDARGEQFSGQHPKYKHKANISFRFSRSPNAVRFLLWWLFLHRRLRSRQRGLMPESIKRHCSFSAVPFQKVSLVFIRTTRKASRLFLASLSASIQGVIAASFRLSLLSNNASPLCPPLPVSVKCP